MTHRPGPAALAQAACLLEATARKPGNVHRFADFADSHYLDFALSALAIGPALDGARLAGLGATVLAAVRATRSLVATNTNLGMVLLLAPLAAVPDGVDLESGVADVLRSATVDDARLAYAAIRLSRPGGLGSAPDQDVGAEPTVTLTEAMAFAAGRDAVARQYATGFADVFRVGVPCLAEWLGSAHPLETSIIATHLTLLARIPDTLVARKRGGAEAREASRRAAEILDAGWPAGAGAAALLDGFDRWLRAEGNGRNPGATADLVTAALFACLRDGTIALPVLKRDWAGPDLSDPADPQGTDPRAGAGPPR